MENPDLAASSFLFWLLGLRAPHYISAEVEHFFHGWEIILDFLGDNITLSDGPTLSRRSLGWLNAIF